MTGRIGLFGGSFDPPHAGHLALARSALEHLALDALHWVPAGQPWQKAHALAPAHHRVAMLELLTAGEPRFVLDRSELERTGPSYTIDTVRALQLAQPQAQLFLVVGQDQYTRLASWRQWQELLLRVTLAVAGRGDGEPQPGAAVLTLPHRVVNLPMPRVDASSTAIRAHCAAGGAAGAMAPAMVPAEVAGYIDRHGLYGVPPHLTQEPARS